MDIPKRFEYLFFNIEKEIDPKLNKRTTQELNVFAEIELSLVHNVAQLFCLQEWMERSILNDAVKVMNEETSTLVSHDSECVSF